jgi:hypothetical protein
VSELDPNERGGLRRLIMRDELAAGFADARRLREDAEP